MTKKLKPARVMKAADIVGRHSVTEVLEPEMSDEEREGLRKSADTTGKRC